MTRSNPLVFVLVRTCFDMNEPPDWTIQNIFSGGFGVHTHAFLDSVGINFQRCVLKVGPKDEQLLSNPTIFQRPSRSPADFPTFS